jgi:hypothetical protein
MAFVTQRSQVTDSNLAYYINQLESFDRTLNMPLQAFTWSRDADLRTDVDLSTEATSFQRSSYAAMGTQGNTGKPWINSNDLTFTGLDINGAKITNSFYLLAKDLVYSKVEFDKSQRSGMPIDAQKQSALQRFYQTCTDNQFYTGDLTDTGSVRGLRGLLNSTEVTTGNVAATGTGGTTTWATKTPDQIIADVQEILRSAWSASGWAVCPNRLLLDPESYALLYSTPRSGQSDVTIYNYIRNNSLCNEQNNVPLEIYSCKWLAPNKYDPASSVRRMVAYHKSPEYVQFPLLPLTPQQPYVEKGVSYGRVYMWGYGGIEIRYPTTILYRDGL